MMNLYKAMKSKQEKKVNNYLHEYAFFAFNDSQFNEGLKKLGADPDELNRIAGGGFILKDKYKGFIELLNNNQQEREAALKEPETGEQFAFDMFRTELANHEYTYTGDATETLEALGMSFETLEENPILKQAFNRAVSVVEY